MTWPRLARTALVVAVLVLAAAAQAQVWGGPAAYSVGGRAANAFVALVGTLPLLLARRWPLPVLVVVLAATAADRALGGQGGYQWFAVLLAVFALGSHAGPVASRVGLGLTAAAVLAVDLPRLQQGDPVDEVLPGWFVVAGTWGLGAWLRHRREAMEELAEKARVLARDRDAAAAAAVVDERARIAQELHDLVAHSMAVIVLQAQAGQRVVDTDVEAARRTLEAIESTGRAGLSELRRLLEVLRVDLAPEEVDPRPGLGDVGRLVERVRDAGLPVQVRTTGVARPLPPGLDLSAYRIVQEALTNVLKHAAASTACVDVAFRPEQVELAISDDGATEPADPGSRAGHGIIGMRERARLFGGSLDAGPGPDGGFRVRAVLPTGPT